MKELSAESSRRFRSPLRVRPVSKGAVQRERCDRDTLHRRLAVGMASAQWLHVRPGQAAVHLHRQHEPPGRRSGSARNALERGGGGGRRAKPGLQRRPPAAQRADDGARPLRPACGNRAAQALCHRLSADVSRLLALERQPLRRREPERRHRPVRHAEQTRTCLRCIRSSRTKISSGLSKAGTTGIPIPRGINTCSWEAIPRPASIPGKCRNIPWAFSRSRTSILPT